MTEPTADDIPECDEREVAIDEGLTALIAAREWERMMLRRALAVISYNMKITVEEVIDKLSMDTDPDYEAAVKTATAAANVVESTEPEKPKLIRLPEKKIIH